MQLAQGIVIVGQGHPVLAVSGGGGLVIIGQGHHVLAAGAVAGYDKARTSCACGWRGGWF